MKAAYIKAAFFNSMSKVISLQGIAFDDKSPFLKGSALAPPLIRESYKSNFQTFSQKMSLRLHRV